MPRNCKLIVLALWALVATSCHHPKPALPADTADKTIPEESDLEKLKRKKGPHLFRVLDSLVAQRPLTFYSKIKCEYTDTNQHASFKTSVRIIKDSVVNPIISFAAIPIISGLITPDSVNLSNKKDRCAVRENLDFIKETFGVAFEYRNIEELFEGIPIGYDTTQRYFKIHDPYKYIISSHKKRVIKKELKLNGGERIGERLKKEDEEDILIKYYLSPDMKFLQRIHVDSPSDTTSIDIYYLSWEMVDGRNVPDLMTISIVTPRNRMIMEMDYDKTEINTPQEIYFVIPEGYENCLHR